MLWSVSVVDGYKTEASRDPALFEGVPQLRLAGDRRKLGRNGFSSDRPRECVDPPENLRDLRDLRALFEGVPRGVCSFSFFSACCSAGPDRAR